MMRRIHFSPHHARFFMLGILAFMILQLNACTSLGPHFGGQRQFAPLETQPQVTQDSLARARELLRKGKLKEANQILISLHKVNMGIKEKNEYHFLNGLIFALKQYEYRNYQRSLRHLEQIKDVPEDQSLYPVYGNILSYLLHEVIRQYYQIKELQKTIDQQELEIMNTQDACSKLKTLNDTLEEDYRKLQNKNQQLREKIKAIMKIDTE